MKTICDLWGILPALTQLDPAGPSRTQQDTEPSFNLQVLLFSPVCLFVCCAFTNPQPLTSACASVPYSVMLLRAGFAGVNSPPLALPGPCQDPGQYCLAEQAGPDGSKGENGNSWVLSPPARGLQELSPHIFPSPLSPSQL